MVKHAGPDPAPLLAAGEQALRGGNAALARSIFEQVLAAQPGHPRANEYLAYILGRSGDAAGAHRRLELACRDPGCSPQALYFLGSSHLQRDEPREAIPRFEAALRKAGDFFEGLHELGTAQSRAGDAVAALASYRKAAGLNPRAATVHFNIGRMHDELGQAADADQSYTRAIELQADFAAAWSQRGMARSELARHPEALADHDRAVQLEARDPDAWTARGVTLGYLERWDDAIASHERAIALDAAHARAWSNKGVSLDALHRSAEALACHHQALAHAGTDAQVRANLARCLHQLERFEEALAEFERALALDAGRAGIWSDCGITLAEMRRHEKALACYDRALALRPDDAATHANRASVLQDMERRVEALAGFERAWSLRPDMANVLGQLLTAQTALCDWTDLSGRLAQLERHIRSGLEVAPFSTLALFDDPELHLLVARSWVQHRWPQPAAALQAAPKEEGERIVLAYYSADFHDHATSYLMAEFFERHDRSRFELVAFSFGPDVDDASRRRLRAAFDRFIDVREMGGEDIAARSRELGVDIAIDLKGFTRYCRPGLFVRRVAPIQVSYLGYPGTTGMAAMDYVLADAVVIPEGAERHYSEKVVRLPHCYQVNDTRRAMAEETQTRREAGLPEQGVVFCSFNNHFKILPDSFGSWMRILRHVEGSVLWLQGLGTAGEANLRKEAAARGVAPERLVFAPFVPQAQHLARYRLADIFLDTLPYGAHTTASDALRAGVPVVTLRGRAFAARVAASLLAAVGLPELVTESAEEYERLAVALAGDPARLRNLRERLAAGRATAPLFDTGQATRAIESAYLEMVRRHRAGLPPDHLDVKAC